MTDPLKVNQSDRDARARECLAATVLRREGKRAVRSGEYDITGVVSIAVALKAMLAFADAEVGCAPEGFVLVPREPTEAMLVAGVKAGVNASPKPWCPEAYAAMLAAAPTPEAQS